jgi:D-glycero-D-manno-heptose 1,7-bisphosphate phosphatase
MLTSGRTYTALILDFDGVICELVEPNKTRGPQKIEEIVISEGLHSLVKAHPNLPIFSITNQPDISRGLVSHEQLIAVFDYVKKEIGSIKQFYVCPHTKEDNCICRKPKNFLVEKILQENFLGRNKTLMIGDKITDVEAGRSSQLDTVLLVNSEKSILTPDTVVINSLTEIVDLFK